MENFTRDGFNFQRWRAGASTFTASMERGARLMRWDIELPAGRREVLFWPEDDPANGPGASADAFAAIPGGNPILFPFMGRNYAAGEKFRWRDPDGAVRPMPQHGWARQGRFEITDAGDASVCALFRPDAAARAGYDYDCEFRVRYRFHELRVECDLELTNRDARPIPWCAGHHFYFRLPWHDGLTRADYTLEIPAKKAWRHAADGKLVAFRAPEPPRDFANPELSDVIFTRLTSNTLSFGPRGGEENITMRVGEEPVPDAWTAVVVWTRAPESPFYCVEPWMGPPNSPEHGNGLRWVAPGASETFTVSVSLE
ncbi:MAG: hypothetical protein LBR07_01340 [Puniceicoccales bacterium]|jgi:galactose mutarotase-like enzyme|nr:hypothetical protein [Puniceicoccales bacterium]